MPYHYCANLNHYLEFPYNQSRVGVYLSVAVTLNSAHDMSQTMPATVEELAAVLTGPVLPTTSRAQVSRKYYWVR